MANESEGAKENWREPSGKRGTKQDLKKLKEPKLCKRNNNDLKGIIRN